MGINMIAEANLYFREGNSDKVYHAFIIEEGGGYMVGFRYGRRNGHMNEGFKTSAPVSLNEAHKVFNSLVLSKTKKGYVLYE